LTTDGEKEWRNRDDEFVNDLQSKNEVETIWNKGWDCLFEALESLNPDDLSKIIYIRYEGHTVIEAINRQLAHYPYHIGQIVFNAKQLKNESWDSLSIPKNSSKKYNNDKFAQEKGIRNFTDEALNQLKNKYEQNTITTLLLVLASCYNVEHNCKDFKTGKFTSEVTINGVKSKLPQYEQILW